MTEANFKNRTLWTGDNLDIMRGLNSESVDLIYLDPPFNSNRDYSSPIGSEAAGAAFKDTWTLNDVDLAWHGLIAEENPGLYGIIDAAGVAHGKGYEVLPDNDGSPAAGDEADSEANRLHLPALRPHGQPLPEADNGQRVWGGTVPHGDYLEANERA